MKALKVIGFLLSTASLLWAAQMQASVVSVDVNTNVHITRLTNSNFEQIDPGLWSINNLFSLGAPLSMHASYDPDAPATSTLQLPQVVANSYDTSVHSFSADSGAFHVSSSQGNIQLSNGELSYGWTDELHISSSWLPFDYQGESYSVASASIAFFDQSASVLANVNLPADQYVYNSFLTNLSTYSVLALAIVKLPPDGIFPNNNWMSNGFYEVYGFFDLTKISVTQVPEPASYLLMLMGFIVLSIRRYSK